MSQPAALQERARACARHIAGLEEALDAERERRAGIVVEMRDAGFSWRDISQAVSKSPSYCAAIVAEAPGPIEVTGVTT